MSKKPTYVWVVYEDESESGGFKGVVAVYARKADAVKRVRQMRRKWCGPGTEDDGGLFLAGGEDGIRLSHWDTKETPDSFSTSLMTHKIVEYDAVREEVRR